MIWFVFSKCNTHKTRNFIVMIQNGDSPHVRTQTEPSSSLPTWFWDTTQRHCLRSYKLSVSQTFTVETLKTCFTVLLYWEVPSKVHFMKQCAFCFFFFFDVFCFYGYRFPCRCRTKPTEYIFTYCKLLTYMYTSVQPYRTDQTQYLCSIWSPHPAIEICFSGLYWLAS